MTTRVGDGLQVRHDHGSAYMSDDLQRELKFFGMESSPAFIREPASRRATGQRLRRAVHPYPEGEPALGQDVRDNRGTASGPPGVQADVQRLLDPREPRVPHATPRGRAGCPDACGGRMIKATQVPTRGATQQSQIEYSRSYHLVEGGNWNELTNSTY